MFAEFERDIHAHVEAGGALTAEFMCEHYLALNKKYYGPDVVVDEAIQYEWARIPHFFMNFYVYQYATGFSAAISLADQILKEGDPAVKRYLEFLSSGSSLEPIEVLRRAGADMETEAPVANAMKVFKSVVDELEGLF
jgi:oligoendopeptidase F